MEKKIDITSTGLEKGIDMAKGFLDKLITPTVEEAGFLLKDLAKDNAKYSLMVRCNFKKLPIK